MSASTTTIKASVFPGIGLVDTATSGASVLPDVASLRAVSATVA